MNSLRMCYQSKEFFLLYEMIYRAINKLYRMKKITVIN